MNKREENKYSMYKAVLSNLNANESVVNSISAFADAKNQLEGLIGSIEAKEMEFNTKAQGKGMVKNSGRKEMMRTLLNIVNAMYVYSNRANKKELSELAKVTESQLKRMRDTLLANYAKSVYSAAQNEAANLADFGIEPEHLSELNTKITEYEAASDSKESGHQSKAAAREALYQAFDDTDVLLTGSLDRLAMLVKDSNPEFYTAYKSARVIKDLGVNKKKTVTPNPEN